MKKTRRILLAKYMMVFGLSLIAISQSSASITKVGNGDDGADLEVLTPITSGPILEARQSAIEAVKKLNVVGIPGLGQLISELERSDLLMAAKNVHPTGEATGAIEISAERGVVYARTFAEPSAATRFFPAAESLTSEQLVALHIHEALHRALPSDIRTNEDKVMHLTLAMTSPGASYDRVRQVAGLYIGSTPENLAQRQSNEMNIKLKSPPVELPTKSRTEFKYDVEVYNEMAFHEFSNVLHGIEMNTSLGGYRQVGPLAIEPVFRARVKLYKQLREKTGIGMSSYDLEARSKIDDHSIVGPFIRFTAKPLDEPTFGLGERDIITLGLFYRNNSDVAYFESDLFYSMGSSRKDWLETVKYNPILSLTGRSGFKWRYVYLGALFDIHASEGREISESEQHAKQMDVGYVYGATPGLMRSSFRILAAGPELGFEGKTIQFKIYGKKILNQTSATFDDLGDVMDRGAGQSIFGTSLSMAF